MGWRARVLKLADVVGKAGLLVAQDLRKYPLVLAERLEMKAE